MCQNVETDQAVDPRSIAVLHTVEEIERDLAHGRIPKTDNVDALLALGFVRNRPQDARDTTWSRAVDTTDRRGGYKHRVIQLAELLEATRTSTN